MKYVKYLWDNAKAAKLSPAEQLVYRSNLLGSDQHITNTGGGNTSAKLMERDPLTGEPVEVLWVKGSGGDLRTSNLSNFASLYREKLLGLRRVYAAMTPRGPKTEAEDRMVSHYPHCTFNLNPRATSIDTPLHSFIPAKHVDHMHPNSVISVAASRRSLHLTREIFGEDVSWTPWLRPGFELGLELARMCEANPNLKGIVMSQHGLINWADGNKECYDLTLRLIDQAAHFIERHDKGEKTFGGAKYQTLMRRATGRYTKFCPGCADKFRNRSVLSAPWNRTRRFCASSTVTTRRGWRSSEHPARIIFCAPRSSRSTLGGTRKRRTWRN